MSEVLTILFVHAAKKFGVTEFVNPRNCGDKSVSQVFSSNPCTQYIYTWINLKLVMDYF